MEEEAVQHGRTVFVKGIAYGIEKDGLEEAFAAIGPVRNCFVVRTKGEAQHKGYGYVQYALREDASTAVKQLSGTMLGGRKLKVEFAAARAPFSERKRKAEALVDPRTGKVITKEHNDGKAKAALAQTLVPGTTSQQPNVQKPPHPASKRPGSRDGVTQPSAKQQLVLTIAVGGIPAGQRTTVEAWAAKVGEVASIDSKPSEDVIRFAKLREDGCTGNPILITFTSARDATAAVAALHTKALAGGQLWARQVSGEGQHHKKWRLIIRNLSFKVTEAELRKELGTAGFVWDAAIARDAQGTSRGFGFVSFTCHADAKRAVQECNMKAIGGRTVAVDWAVAKAKYLAVAAGSGAPAESAPAAAAMAGPVPPDSDAEPSGDDDRRASRHNDTHDADLSDRETAALELPIADEKEMQRSLLASILGTQVVHKGTQEDGSKAKISPANSSESDSGNVGAEGELQDGEDSDHSSADVASMDDMIAALPVARSDLGTALTGQSTPAPNLRLRPAATTSPSSSSSSAAAAAAAAVLVDTQKERATQAAPQGHTAKKKQKTDHSTAEAATSTPAVRQLTDAERLLQKQAAQLSAPPRDPKARDSGGGGVATTVFVRGLPAAATEASLRSAMLQFGPLKACRMVVDKATQQPKGTAFVEFRTADSAARAADLGKGVSGPGLLVCGQKVLADVALSKDDARTLAVNKGTFGKAAADRRNLYLAVEGQIREGDPAWEQVPPGDRPRRKRAADDKALKLKSPNFAVSRTRLSIRNIPSAMNEAVLKKLALQAVKAHATKANPRVKQAKILTEEGARVAAGFGGGPRKSRGRGFVEFTEHEHAIAALRHLNNNPEPFGSQHRPIVEFAIDDMQKLLKRRQRLEAPRGPKCRPGTTGADSRQPLPTMNSIKTKDFGRGGPGGGRGRGGKSAAVRAAAVRAGGRGLNVRGRGGGRAGVQKPSRQRAKR